RRWLRSRTRAAAPARWTELRRLRQSIGGETALAAGVLAVTALLVATPPGKTVWRPTSSFHLSAGPVRVQLSVVPLGPNQLDLRAAVLGAAGQPQAVPELTATAQRLDSGISGLPVTFTRAGPGQFVASGVTLPFPGRWTLQLRIRTSAIDEYTATAQFTVR